MTVPEGVSLEQVDIWFQDETRVGQQGSTTRLWARKGTRPRAVQQRQFEYSYLYGATCPSTGASCGLVLPSVNKAGMALHLAEIAQHVPQGRHAIVVVDGAGWHQSCLNLPNLSLLKLPAYAPELNPMEQVWLYLKQRFLSNRCFKDYDEIVSACCNAWMKIESDVETVQSICHRGWACI